MKKNITKLFLALGLILTGQTAFSQSKKTMQPYLLAPVEEPVGDTGGGGGGYTPPPVYGGFIPEGSDHTGNFIILYEGNNCTQDEVLRHPLNTPTQAFNVSYKDQYSGSNFIIVGFQFMFGVGPNDEARSLALQGVKAGRMMEFYDSPEASKNDDWVEILVKQDISSFDRYQIYSFEHSYEDAYVKVIYHSHNGLDGKVSSIKTFMAF